MRIFLLIAVFALLTPIYGLEPTDETLKNIRKDHPRLFLTQETLPAVRKRCLTTQKKRFAALLDKVDKYPEKPEFKLNPSRITKSKDGKYHIAKPHYMLAHVLPLGGIQAEQSAFAIMNESSTIGMNNTGNPEAPKTASFTPSIGNPFAEKAEATLDKDLKAYFMPFAIASW